MGSSETIKFHLGLYTVKLAEPENTMFGARIGGEVGEPLYIQAELQPILCSSNNKKQHIANKGRSEVSLGNTVRLVDPQNPHFDARTLHKSSTMPEL